MPRKSREKGLTIQGLCDAGCCLITIENKNSRTGNFMAKRGPVLLASANPRRAWSRKAAQRLFRRSRVHTDEALEWIVENSKELRPEAAPCYRGSLHHVHIR